MAEGFVHTVYVNGRWVNSLEGQDRAVLGTFDTKEEAIAYAQRRRGGHCACNGVRDVVKLQIEKNAIAACGELLDDAWTLAREQVAADLEPANGPSQLIGERPRLGSGVDVKRD